MLRAEWRPYRLNFNFEARTSRAVMRHKDTYFVRVWDDSVPDVYGLGECALFAGLSAEDDVYYERDLDQACRVIADGILPTASSSVRIGLETALADLHNGGSGRIFPGSDWLEGRVSIPINGLIWMGDKQTMAERIQEKLDAGFKLLKLKIGGIKFEEELELLKLVRSHFAADQLEIRLDANGAFSPADALAKIDRLAQYDIHSLEQPIKARQYAEMAKICRNCPIPIALDEELIGVFSKSEKAELLDAINPQYIILKPSLCGGFASADEWIDLAIVRDIGWWATSALESNIGLNAIAQWVALKSPSMAQGLGTGQLYANNLASQLRLVGADLYFNPKVGRAEYPSL